MIETGKPFKMKPKTREAERALWETADLLGLHMEEVMWILCKVYPDPIRPLLVRANGDEQWDTLQLVRTQDDPDWEIVNV